MTFKSTQKIMYDFGRGRDMRTIWGGHYNGTRRKLSYQWPKGKSGGLKLHKGKKVSSIGPPLGKGTSINNFFDWSDQSRGLKKSISPKGRYFPTGFQHPFHKRKGNRPSNMEDPFLVGTTNTNKNKFALKKLNNGGIRALGPKEGQFGKI